MAKIKRKPEFNLFTGKDNQCYFNLVAPNHEIILASEGYKARAGAENAIKSVQKNSQITERFERRIAKNNQPYFVLKAANGEIIGVSETYSSKQAMEKGISAVMRYGATTNIDDKKVDVITIIINGETYKLTVMTLTVLALLELAGLDSNEYCLQEVGSTSDKFPELSESIALSDGKEFMAILKDIKFGYCGSW